MAISFSLETNLNNWLRKYNDIVCLRMAYKKHGKVYLIGLMTGLAAFLRAQLHDREEWHTGIEIALKEITEGNVSRESLEKEMEFEHE